jgi:hypothetical protein
VTSWINGGRTPRQTKPKATNCRLRVFCTQYARCGRSNSLRTDVLSIPLPRLECSVIRSAMLSLSVGRSLPLRHDRLDTTDVRC